MPLSPEQIAEFDKITGAKTPTATSTPTSNDTSEIDAAIQGATKKVSDDASTNADKATFQAPVDQQINGLGDIGSIAARTTANIPKSAFKFGKGILTFPLDVTKNAIAAGKGMVEAGKDGVPLSSILKEVPHEVVHQTYQTLVPQFLQHIFSGDFGKASATVQNDPVGQILPLILVARQGAESMGKGEQFDSAISKLASPATKAGEALKTAAGQVVSQVFGAGTGAGASSVSEAYKASKAGGDTADAFRKAMRGETSPEEIVKSAHDIVGNIKETRGNAYVEQLKNVGEDTNSHDISSITKALKDQMSPEKFNIKVGKDGQLDFSRSSIANNGTARADIQGVYDTVKSWGTKSGDRTGIGLDTLKKQLGDFYSPSSQARAFVQGVKTPVVNLLNKEVPGYQDMTSGYSKVSDFLDEIKSATGAGSNSRPDTVFTKLTAAMKGDKEFRLQIMDEMTKSDPTFMAKIAGTNMSSWIPKGLVGKGIDVSAGISALSHVFNPAIIPALLATSPRVVGEFARAMGLGAGQIEPILKAINTFKVPASMEGKMGMSIKDISTTPEEVAKKFDSFDIKLVQNYLDNPQDPKTYMKIQPILEGAKLDQADPSLVDRFLKETLDLAKKKKK